MRINFVLSIGRMKHDDPLSFFEKIFERSHVPQIGSTIHPINPLPGTDHVPFYGKVLDIEESLVDDLVEVRVHVEMNPPKVFLVTKLIEAGWTKEDN